MMLPALTVVAKIAPKAMNAPARTLNTRTLKGSVVAFLTPISSAPAPEDCATRANSQSAAVPRTPSA